MCCDDLALGHDHHAVDVALDRDHPERECPGHAVAVAVEGDGLILVDRRLRGGSRRGRTDARAAAPPPRGPRRVGLRSGTGRRATARPAARSASQRLRKNAVQFLEIGDTRHRRGEPALHGLDGPLGVGLLVAAGGHAEEGVEDVVAGQRGVPRVELAVTPLKDQRSNSSWGYPTRPPWVRRGRTRRPRPSLRGWPRCARTAARSRTGRWSTPRR